MMGGKWRSWLIPGGQAGGQGLAGQEQHIHAGGSQRSLQRGGIRETILFTDNLGPDRHCMTPSLHGFVVHHVGFPLAWIAQLSHTLYVLTQDSPGRGQPRYIQYLRPVCAEDGGRLPSARPMAAR